MSLSNTESDLLRRLTVALERSAAADEKRNDLLVTDAAERRLTWAASEARSEAALERIVGLDPKESLNAVYAERNRVVAALVHLFVSWAWVDYDPDAPGYTVVYIELPTGQVSWHIPDAEFDLFPPLERRTAAWDGHDPDEKYRRLAALRHQ